MLYRTLGLAIWKAGSWYLRRRFASQARVATALAVLTGAGAAYVAARGGEHDAS